MVILLAYPKWINIVAIVSPFKDINVSIGNATFAIESLVGIHVRCTLEDGGIMVKFRFKICVRGLRASRQVVNLHTPGM
jgi:hypothetical protein